MAPRALRMLISAGPTREALDPVRFISNYSTGYMGAQLAAAALARGHRVTVVSGPSPEPLPPAARVIPVETTHEMAARMRQEARSADAIIMAAAVADFRAARTSATKLRRRAQRTLRLQATPDVIAQLPRRPRQVRVGFALESSRVVPHAVQKLLAKQLDLLVAQRVNGSAGPFGRCRVRAWLIERGGTVTRLGQVSKPTVARVLLDKIEELWYGGQRARHTSLCATPPVARWMAPGRQRRTWPDAPKRRTHTT